MSVFKNVTNAKLSVTANRGTGLNEIIIQPSELKVIPNTIINSYTNSIYKLIEIGSIVNVYAPSDVIPHDKQIMIFDASINDWKYITLSELLNNSTIAPKWETLAGKPEVFTEEQLRAILQKFKDEFTVEWGAVYNKPGLCTKSDLDDLIAKISSGTSNMSSVLIEATTDNYTCTINRLKLSNNVMVLVYKVLDDDGNMEIYDKANWRMTFNNSSISLTFAHNGKYQIFYLS